MFLLHAGMCVCGGVYEALGMFSGCLDDLSCGNAPFGCSCVPRWSMIHLIILAARRLCRGVCS